MTSDTELVGQVLAGRNEAYGELVRRWAGPVVALCHVRTGPAHADDLAQETLLRGFRDLASLDDPERFGAWLRGIARNVCRDWVKDRRNAEVPFSALDGHVRPDLCLSDPHEPSGGAERADEVRHLLNAVEALPEDYREVLLLYYYNDVTYKDLAALLGVSAATVNARLTNARALLRERLRTAKPGAGSA